jgi:PhnB protein
MAKPQPIPEGYHTLTPYLIVKGCARALEFYRNAFGAEELYRMAMPDGRIGHAEMRVGDSIFMLADEFPERDIRAPQGSPPVSLAMYVEDVDALWKRAIGAGGREHRPLQNQFYGDRSGTLTDPFGHQWTIASHVEDVSPEEMKRRMAQQH